MRDMGYEPELYDKVVDFLSRQWPSWASIVLDKISPGFARRGIGKRERASTDVTDA